MSMGLKVAYGGSDSRPDETALVVVPLYHGWGLNFSITAVDRGSKIVLMRKFNPLGVLKIIKEEKIDTFLAVPPMLQRMAWVPGFESYLVGLRTIETYETFPPGLREEYVRQGATIRRTYGLVETGYVTMGSGLEASGKSESDGCPLFCTKVRIIDDDGIELSAGEVGEITVRSPSLMKEYWGRPEATAETFKDGWLHTGDLGRLDEDGYLYMIGRKKDIIVSGGEVIAPAEVERVLRQNPKILEVAIVGRPDSVWGEKVCAVVRPAEGARIGVEELAAFCQGKLATFQIPKEVIITNEPLPYDMTSGKLVRRVLRERLSLTQTSASSY
jgi:acyl-CoA synthetase (AMP-forming)/AMP-acid ligase II